jgi:hypothetical protein
VLLAFPKFRVDQITLPPYVGKNRRKAIFTLVSP